MTIRRRRNTIAELVADIHALLDCVWSREASVTRIVWCTGESLITVYSVGGTVRVGVILILVGGAKSLSWRRDSGGGRRRNSSAAAI